MSIFFITLVFLFSIICWQSILYLTVPRGHVLRKRVLARVALLALVVAIVTYAWRSALAKETEFLTLLPPYPESHLDMFKTPIFSSSAYWTYQADATADEVFNWYRSRSKHAGWKIADEGQPHARVFVIVVPPRISIFVVLKEDDGKTTVTYTTEGTLMRKTITQ